MLSPKATPPDLLLTATNWEAKHSNSRDALGTSYSSHQNVASLCFAYISVLCWWVSKHLYISRLISIFFSLFLAFALSAQCGHFYGVCFFHSWEVQPALGTSIFENVEGLPVCLHPTPWPLSQRPAEVKQPEGQFQVQPTEPRKPRLVPRVVQSCQCLHVLSWYFLYVFVRKLVCA